MEPLQLLTPEQVAEMLAVPARTIKDWLRSGRLRGVKLGGTVWRVEEKDLVAFVEEGRQAAAQAMNDEDDPEDDLDE